ncbi:molybdenum ABC transporter ATP-binding protein [Proteiniphilum propionicum]|uniref:molybdenum ABC transporter ATP-binding protein n=1 Tax=Proteiniphilum propionicum TaxID=2829812 RepID=UPI001EEA0791|nr:molybdenum ABC transporter ATP-binding protein [Proteiniphilum propionicum]ULB34344.1 molybdenum ABC transporter ATP-binding protein [Proteiniphilum propionicum]
MKPIAVKFVSHEIPPLDAYNESKVFKLRVKLNNGEPMNRAEKNWLTENVRSNAYFRTAVPLMGWRFDFSDVLKKYVVKQYDHWAEYYAPDKTSLRSVLFGKIDQIVEIPDK